MEASGGGGEARVPRVPSGHDDLAIALASKSRCHRRRWSNGAGVYEGRSWCRHKFESRLGTDGVKAVRLMSSSEEGKHLEKSKGLEKEDGLREFWTVKNC